MRAMIPIICAYIILTLISASVSQQDPSGAGISSSLLQLHPSLAPSPLSDLLERASGYYVDGNRSIAANLTRTVLCTGANYGYLNQLSNFRCFAERLGLKFLVLSMDIHTHTYVASHGMLSYHWNETANVTEGESEFRERNFNMISNLKKHAVGQILSLGYDVLFSDPDVVFLRDPMSYLNHRNMDYVHSVNALCPHGDSWQFKAPQGSTEGNTGFYFVRSTKATAYLWLRTYEESFRYPELDDQTIFWRLIRSSELDIAVYPVSACRDLTTEEIQGYVNSLPKTSSFNASAAGEDLRIIATCPLDNCLFSAGMLRGYSGGSFPELVRQLVHRNLSSPVTIHANFITGNNLKQKRLESHGLWLATHREAGVSWSSWDGPCAPFADDQLTEGKYIRLHGSRDVYQIKDGKKCLSESLNENDKDSLNRLASGMSDHSIITVNLLEFSRLATGPPLPNPNHLRIRKRRH